MKDDNEHKCSDLCWNLEIEKLVNVILHTENQNILKDYEINIEGMNNIINKEENNPFSYITESGKEVIRSNVTISEEYEFINMSNMKDVQDKLSFIYLKDRNYTTRINNEEVEFKVDNDNSINIHRIKSNVNIKYKRKEMIINKRFQNLYFRYNLTMQQLILLSFVSMKDILPIPNEESSDKYRGFYNFLEYDNIYLSNQLKSNDNPLEIFQYVLANNNIPDEMFKCKIRNEYKCFKCDENNIKEKEMNCVRLLHTYYKPIYSFKRCDRKEYNNKNEEIIFEDNNNCYYVISRERNENPLSDLYVKQNGDNNREYIEVAYVYIIIFVIIYNRIKLALLEMNIQLLQTY